MTKEQKLKAIEVIEGADKIGEGEYFTFKRKPELEAMGIPPWTTEIEGPCCAVGWLAWAANVTAAPMGPKLYEAYGLRSNQRKDLEQISDDTPEEERKKAILDYLNSIETED